ncbi:gamma-glutamyl-gamma-aminobutyrate hydrolase family protein [Streptomyces sp. NPDC020799]|uniref:gamma-glutamyl-gamma-aminobutyrate hydrolase family protein n=1 Tax=Streptomyces sp. NPDC020799 TaxID=3365091 RepID=UPI0037A7FD46
MATHHQSVGDAGMDLTVSAHADDGIIDAAEYRDHPSRSASSGIRRPATTCA